jgi:hypothetical protein
MLPANQLAQHTASLTVDPDAAQVTARRGEAGRVWLTCSCGRAVADGWCWHELALLSGRTENVVASDKASVNAFEQIIGGTRVQEAGRALDQATTAFENCLKIFDEKRPRRISGHNLGRFADLITDLAACAGELEDAAGTFRRLLMRT